MSVKNLISIYSYIFWDFDGVIKESVDVKTQAYIQLFESFGTEVTEMVREHHIFHGGMSRFDKLPQYMKWAGLTPNQTSLNEYCEQFSQRVLQGVIDAPWVAGVESYLRRNYYRQNFVLVSATPQDELMHILRRLDITSCFSEIYGAPTRKQEAISKTLITNGLVADDCLMIGDARADLEAATTNQIHFLLRRHRNNTHVFESYNGASVYDFNTI